VSEERNRRSEEDDDDRPRRRFEDDDLPEPVRKKSGLGLPLLIGGIVVAVLAVCAGGITLIAVGLVLPARQKVISAGERVTASNKLKQIGLGANNFELDQYCYPSNSVDASGRKLLSWRVHLLPYVNEQALYNQFNLDEPWDSPQNKALLNRMPDVYASKGFPAGQSMTQIRGFQSPGSVFAAPMRFNKNAVQPPRYSGGSKLSDVRDGLSNTIMCIYATTPVEWTKPSDLDSISLNQFLEFDGSYMFQTMDGSVRTFKKQDYNDQTFRSGIHMGDGGFGQLP
jgi:Protein of unknown function (DUF1559)